MHGTQMQMGIGSKPVALQSAPLAPVFIPKGGGKKISKTQYRRQMEQMTSTAPMGERQSFEQPLRRRLSRRRSGVLLAGGPRAGLTRVGLEGTIGMLGFIGAPPTKYATPGFGLGFSSSTCGRQVDDWSSSGATRLCGVKRMPAAVGSVEVQRGCRARSPCTYGSGWHLNGSQKPRFLRNVSEEDTRCRHQGGIRVICSISHPGTGKRKYAEPSP